MSVYSYMGIRFTAESIIHNYAGYFTYLLSICEEKTIESVYSVSSLEDASDIQSKMIYSV